MEQMPAPSYAPRKIEYKEPKKLPITAIAVVIVIAILAAGVYFLLQPAPKPKLAITVKTTDGYVMDGAVARITGPQTLSRDVSGGSTELELQPGDYQVTVSAFGFDSKTLSAHLPGESTLRFELVGMRFTIPQQVPLAPRDSYSQGVTVFNDKGDAVTVRIDADSSLKRYFGMPDAFPAAGKKAVNITVMCEDTKQADCVSGLKPAPVKEGDRLVYGGNLQMKLLNGTSPPKTTVTVPFKLVFEKEKRQPTFGSASLTLTEGQNDSVSILMSNTGAVPLRNVVIDSVDEHVLGFSLGESVIAGKPLYMAELGPTPSKQQVRIFLSALPISVPTRTYPVQIEVSYGLDVVYATVSLTVQKPKT